MAQDPDQPDLLTGKNTAITIETLITDLSMPDCSLVSQDSGYGYGSVNASAEIYSDGKKIRFTLGHPQDFQGSKTAVGQWGDQQVPVSMSAMIPSKGNFIDGEDFSEGGGTIQSDCFFEVSLKRLQRATDSCTAMFSLFDGRSNKLAGVEMRSCWITLKD